MIHQVIRMFFCNLLLYSINIYYIEVCSKSKLHSTSRQKQPPEVFYKKSVLRNFEKITGKHLCQRPQTSGIRPATLLKVRLWHMCFFVNFVKFLRTPFLTEHLWWLLLHVKLKFIQGKSNPLYPRKWKEMNITQ